MISRDVIAAQLDNCLTDTSFLGLSGRRGKVRDVYDLGETLMLVATDRLSAFDRNIAAIPFKGQVLNQISGFWFEQTRDIVLNQLIDIPDPNVTIARKCDVFPIEFVMRGYLTGSTETSAWSQYAKGNRCICGNELPDGMVKNQHFDTPLLTPTTKSDEHDESITAREIVERGIIDAGTWEQLSSIVFALFARGRQLAARHGLILVDTKYELGRTREGDICLIDEIHTPDSSRYWLADSYEERLAAAQEPENIDKEFIRLWFREHCDPYHDESLPKAPPELVVELASRYITLFEKITGAALQADTREPVQQRMKRTLATYLPA